MDAIVAGLLTYGPAGMIAAVGLFVGLMQYRRNNQLVDAIMALAKDNGKTAAESSAAMNRLADMLDVRGKR